ncbi:PIN domain-containing protein [Candidatus Parcubacteria bacterium]|nr:MAG: PIN domain-containing protein [Candidatus Parcubacteria bacterium]
MIVADTNLIAFLAMPSPYTEIAERLLVRDPEWAAPMLWRSEFRNVLALYLRKGLIRFEQALEIQAEMESLFQGKEYEVASLNVLSLVNQSECSAYDCEFVALAKGLGVKLVTMDRKLTASFPETATLLTDLKL